MTAYTDLFNVGIDNLASTLATITGLRVVTDPRDLNPPCVFLGAPTFEAWNYNIVKLTFQVTVIVNGPGNLDALRASLSVAAQLLGKNVAVTSGNPTTVNIGGQEFPAYELTISEQAQTA